MGKAQKKTGKGRLDKYYKLAKEQGYRARSAFKLIQLNKKFAFLESARCCIDLCAAPGGWLQVASKYMPANSVIVGVDLVSIKPIPRVVTFTADITTIQCRNLIRNELKDWKADVVLHDGAPNVGTAWVQDAYSQSELVLMSLKLAVELLVRGGTFVTKVFRSADYNNLMWVFGQLFGKVEATKPPSSRNVSAEIFVVCRDFLAPRHIDPKFLDPKHVFKDLSASSASGLDKGSSANNAHQNVFMPEKKRRKRDGYDDGDYTLFRQVPAGDFVRSTEPISVLGLANKIVFQSGEEKGWLDLSFTTPDVKTNCDDLKVLGKRDFKTLLKWRLTLREELGLDTKAIPIEELTESVEVTEVIDEEQQIQQELERLKAEASAKAKRERRRANELKTKTIQRMQLQMTAPLEIGLELNDLSLKMGQEDVFDLVGAEKGLNRHGGLIRLINDEEIPEDNIDEEDEELEGEGVGDEVLDVDQDREKKLSALEAELDGMYDAYQEKLKERDTKHKAKEIRRKNGVLEEWPGVQNHAGDDSDGDPDEGGWEEMVARKQTDQDSSSDEESDGDHVGQKRTRQELRSVSSNKKVKLITDLREPPLAPTRVAQVWFSQDMFKDVDTKVEDAGGGQADEDVDMSSTPALSRSGGAEFESGDDEDLEIVPRDHGDDAEMWEVHSGNPEDERRGHVEEYGLNTAEAVTLAQQLVNRQTTTTRLIDDGFNRYSLNAKDGLPAWFLDDEAKHYKPNIPITREAVTTLRARQRALDARPIKKIAEAKGRKRLRAARRLEKAMKKAEVVNANADMTESEKAKQIEALMKKGASKAKQKEVKVIVAKGGYRGVKGRPKGVKGRYTMVDARMRKETRAEKRREKGKGKRR
ncbi:Spb1 C-terminal domain-containing protein [Pisolithus croceorrhizus]|nr:Spb1 C-terminal domain-containing protein [Pisolithus croceorrhizus]